METFDFEGVGGHVGWQCLKQLSSVNVRCGWKPVPERSSIRAHALGSSREHSGWRQIWPFFLKCFLLSFLREVGRGGGEDDSCSNASMRWCLGMFPPPSQAQPFALSTWRQPVSARLCFWPCCCLPVCFVLTSSGLMGPGPALRQTSTCVCTVLGM